MNKNLDELINEIETKMKNRDLSDEYLRENNCADREKIGIGDYAYGITMIPCEWIIDYLKELREIESKGAKAE